MNSTNILLILLNIIWKLTIIKGFSSCFSESGRAKFCEPDFINVAQNATFEVTSTCGQKGSTDRICRNWYTSSGLNEGKCLKCDDRIPELSRNISLVFDRNIQGHETVWVSGRIPKFSGIHSINITISLNKLYEVYYIIVEFAGQLPDSMVLYKRDKNGKTWLPWNYFSSSCKKSFKMKRSKPLHIQQRSFNKISPACFSFKHSVQNITSNIKVLPFNPMTGRTSLLPNSRLIKEWVSVTDIMISLLTDGSKKRNKSPYDHLSISDITIGARSQCYGHAKSLIKKNGTTVCDCLHKTAGPDCSQCLKTHNDQPWKIIFPSEPAGNICERCFCNNHAEECKFDEKIYKNSSGKHGSRCLHCLHHTTGPHCNSCSPGYYRNRAFPINHPQVCQKCGCHPYGSLPQSYCNPDNGICQCKIGVEGKLCNRCKKGYQQTKSSSTPCAPETKNNLMATEERCGSCGKNRPRIRFRKFCKKHIMIKISIQSKEIHGEWTRFGVRVLKIWRIQQSLKSQVNLYESEYSIYPIWVENADIRCKCPNLQLGHTYLLLTKIKLKNYLNQPELIVDRKSSALDWSDDWIRRLDMFKMREEQGKCDRYQYKRKHSKLMNSR